MGYVTLTTKMFTFLVEEIPINRSICQRCCEGATPNSYPSSLGGGGDWRILLDLLVSHGFSNESDMFPERFRMNTFKRRNGKEPAVLPLAAIVAHNP